MNGYNIIEKKIAEILSNNPKIKKKIKYLYQVLNLYIHKSNDRLKNPYNIDLERFGSGEKDSYFGYYNNSPSNGNGNVAWIEINKESADIIVDNIKINNTKAYNLQQGCMLTWLDNNRLIYNDLEETNYCSKIIDIDGKVLSKLNKPIYTVSKNRKFALSLDFERLSILRPDYGYSISWQYNIKDYSDGINSINLVNGDIKNIITFNDILDFDFENLKEYKHKLNHIDISPDNKKFIFIHRWIDHKGKKESRLLLADCEGNIKKVIADEGLVSHCCWRDENTIIGWFKHNGINNYYSFDIENESYNSVEHNRQLLIEDGHPSIKNNILLTDSYPDKARFSRIILFDLESQKGTTLLSLFSPMKFFEEKRCDLHPRWGESEGDNIFFDATFEGKRYLYRCKFIGELHDFCSNECI